MKKDGIKIDAAPERGAPQKSAWRDPAVEMPDDDVTVLVRQKSEAYPTAAAYHEDDYWWNFGGSGPDDDATVTGWMHLHEAAAILDAAEGGGDHE